MSKKKWLFLNCSSEVSRGRLHRMKVKNRVKTEVYRLEESARRSRQDQELHSRKGSHISRSFGSAVSRRSGSSRRSIELAASPEVSPSEAVTRRKTDGQASHDKQSALGSRSVSQDYTTRRSSSMPRQPKAAGSPKAAQQTSPKTPATLKQEAPAQRRGTTFRRLSDMSPEEKVWQLPRWSPRLLS